MSKVQPAIRRRYCVCGRPCADVTLKAHTPTDSGELGGSNEPPADFSRGVDVEKPAPAFRTPERVPPPPDSLTLLQLKVRALEKYKTNYELLCSQLAELNAQVGLQLQRHEVDVTTLQSTISALQTTNAALQHELQDARGALQSLKATSEKDREYAGGAHKQLTTVAGLLKAAEKRLQEQERERDSDTKKRHAAQEETRTVVGMKETLEREVASLKEQIARQGDAERLQRKYRQELKRLRHEMEALRDELETQRAATRHAKKQCKQLRDERDILAKQLGHVQSDGAHLAEILESQRDELARQEKKTQRWKQQHQESELRLQETIKSLEDLQTQLTSVQEELVAKNTRVEALLLEAREAKQRLEQRQSESAAAQQQVQALQTQLECVQHEYASQRKQIDLVVKQDEHEAKEMQRRYRKEMQHMKQLLSLNQQRTTESSHDMQVLKQELSSVQHLLKECHSQRARRRRCRAATADGATAVESDEEMAWRLRHQREEVEKAVLQSAIREQVETAW